MGAIVCVALRSLLPGRAAPRLLRPEPRLPRSDIDYSTSPDTCPPDCQRDRQTRSSHVSDSLSTAKSMPPRGLARQPLRTVVFPSVRAQRATIHELHHRVWRLPPATAPTPPARAGNASHRMAATMPIVPFCLVIARSDTPRGAPLAPAASVLPSFAEMFLTRLVRRADRPPAPAPPARRAPLPRARVPLRVRRPRAAAA